MGARNHRAGGTSVSVDEVIAELTPAVDWLLAQIQPGEFTTTDFIQFMQSVPRTKAAYDEAIARWGEPEKPSKMVIHGQVIPAILRHSSIVEWIGYAYELEDEYAVPAWWRINDVAPVNRDSTKTK
jgi:hypothetical protein